LSPQYGNVCGRFGEMAEWSNAVVLKTIDCYRSGGSNPSLSATKNPTLTLGFFYVQKSDSQSSLSLHLRELFFKNI
jgi:hypothetical protein